MLEFMLFTVFMALWSWFVHWFVPLVPHDLRHCIFFTIMGFSAGYLVARGEFLSVMFGIRRRRKPPPAPPLDPIFDDPEPRLRLIEHRGTPQISRR